MIMKRFTWPAELTLNLIGGKWKSLILHRLLEGESRRFGELKRLLPGISAKMLAKHLKELEFDGLRSQVFRVSRAEPFPDPLNGPLTAIIFGDAALFSKRRSFKAAVKFSAPRPSTRQSSR